MLILPHFLLDICFESSERLIQEGTEGENRKSSYLSVEIRSPDPWGATSMSQLGLLLAYKVTHKQPKMPRTRTKLSQETSAFQIVCQQFQSKQTEHSRTILYWSGNQKNNWENISPISGFLSCKIHTDINLRSFNKMHPACWKSISLDVSEISWGLSTDECDG